MLRIDGEIKTVLCHLGEISNQVSSLRAYEQKADKFIRKKC